jgi:5'-phosphate synthase pdxT subunit
MVKPISIGIIGIQGAISEHVTSMNRTLKKNKRIGKVFVLRNKFEIKSIDALIIPGGESTTISKFIHKLGLYDEILNRINDNNLYIMGTCAGCVLLSKHIINDNKDIKLLEAMDIRVIRNAFGRQKESFEYKINIIGFKKLFNGVFIRAPLIDSVFGNCTSLSKINDKIIMARQDKFLALSFHPELTNDLRIHEYFLKMIDNC